MFYVTFVYSVESAVKWVNNHDIANVHGRLLPFLPLPSPSPPPRPLSKWFDTHANVKIPCIRPNLTLTRVPF